MEECALDNIILFLPLIVCTVAITAFLLQYKKTREVDWLYFIAAFGFYGLGEIVTNIFENFVIFPFDVIFYALFYIAIILYFRNMQKGLIKKYQQKKDFSLKRSGILLTVDLIAIMLFSFVVFYCFDRLEFTAIPSFQFDIKKIDNFIYPIFDFILFGYYLYISKSYIINDRMLKPVLTLGFVLWAVSDTIFAFEAISVKDNYQIGGILMLLDIIAYIFVVIIVKAKINNANYTTIDVYRNSSKYNHLTAYMTTLIFGYVAILIYSYLNYRSYYYAMNIIYISGIGLLFLTAIRQAINSIDSFRKIKILENDASIDPLTGLFTRRHAFNIIKSVYKISGNFNVKISALMIDIDHFKKYNDTWGHDCGDQVLKNIAKIVKNSIKTSSIICRYGGEEILVIMPGIGKSDGSVIAENVRKNVEKHTFFADRSKPIGKVTVSIGGSTSNKTIVDEFDLIKKADTALYESKKNRNSCFWIND